MVCAGVVPAFEADDGLDDRVGAVGAHQLDDARQWTVIYSYARKCGIQKSLEKHFETK
jgi:hypothetical protein